MWKILDHMTFHQLDITVHDQTMVLQTMLIRYYTSLDAWEGLSVNARIEVG